MKILCKLPNAAGVINGVKFFEHKLGMLSEELEESVANEFLKIKGYVRLLPPKSETPEAAPAPAPAPASTAVPSAQSDAPAPAAQGDAGHTT